MALHRGAPALYHAARVPDRIIEILREEPWLTKSMIQRRVGPMATPKTVESRILEMFRQGILQRRLVRTPIREMYAYALPDAPSFRGPHSVRIRKELMERTGFWRSHERVLSALRRKPWQTAAQLVESSGVPRGFIYNVLRALEDSGEVRRARIPEVAEGGGRGPRYLWAPREVPEPRKALPDGRDVAKERTLVRVAELVEAHPDRTAHFYLAQLRRSGRDVSYSRVCKVLKELEELGVVTRFRRGPKANRWRANGRTDWLRLRAAEAYYRQLQHAAKRLREVGYEVTIEVRWTGKEVQS
jgi:DNA-binding transcriptional ArsR family regulator